MITPFRQQRRTSVPSLAEDNQGREEERRRRQGGGYRPIELGEGFALWTDRRFLLHDLDLPGRAGMFLMCMI